MDTAKNDFDALTYRIGDERMSELCLEFIATCSRRLFNPSYMKPEPELEPKLELEELPSRILEQSSIVYEPQESILDKLRIRNFYWPYMRAKNFLRECYTGRLSELPKRLNYDQTLEILATRAKMTVDQLIHTNPIDYAHRFLYRDYHSCFAKKNNQQYLTDKILRDFLLKGHYGELQTYLKN